MERVIKFVLSPAEFKIIEDTFIGHVEGVELDVRDLMRLGEFEVAKIAKDHMTLCWSILDKIRNAYYEGVTAELAQKITYGDNLEKVCECEYSGRINDQYSVNVYREDYRVNLNNEYVKRSVYHVVVIDPITKCVIWGVRTFKRYNNAINCANKTRNDIENNIKERG